MVESSGIIIFERRNNCSDVHVCHIMNYNIINNTIHIIDQ